MPVTAQMELDFREIAREEHISPKRVKTLQSLLDQISISNSHAQVSPMLNTTASHISRWLGKPPTEIPISLLTQGAPEFGTFLRQCRYKRNSVRSYLNFLRILITAAKALGWEESSPELLDRWKPLLLAIRNQGRNSGMASIPKYALQMGISPAAFDDSHLDAWANRMLKRGSALSVVSNIKRSFLRFVSRNGFVTGLRNFPTESRTIYRTAYECLPEALRQEIAELLEWKVAEFSDGRPERNRHRPVTARQLRDMLCRIHGFLMLTHAKSISTLVELLSEQNLRKYVKWLINERRNSGRYLLPWLSILYSTVKTFPRLEGQNFSWLPELIRQLPHKNADIQTQEAKARKWVDYDALYKIPAKLRNERSSIEKKGSRRAALLCRNELLISWLNILPWRQRNLRECKMGKKEIGGNLFKCPISSSVAIAKPTWAEEKLKVNPNEEFWQFFFRPDETKTGQQVHSLLPKQLIPLLEEYLENYRPLLVKGNDPGTLFLNESGGSISAWGILTIVGNATYRYAGRRVNPHLFRDIFAVKWLELHPEDFLTVSKLLWHRNVQTTLKVYGRNFDESQGVRRMEEWLEKRCAP